MSARWFATLFVLGLLMAPASAIGGGWATVGLSSTPEGIGKGQPWNVDVEVLQHGQTPLADVKPTITITESRTGASRTFSARPTGGTGVYRARVVFPSSGAWTYKVDDGFSQEHQFAQVRIGESAPASTAAGSVGDGDDFPWAALGGAIVAGLAAAGLTMAVQRRRERGASDQQGAMPAGG